MPTRAVSVVDSVVETMFGANAPQGTTHALVIAHRGNLVLQRYGVDVSADTTLRSWSMAKSVLHAAVGVAGIDPDEPVRVPEISHTEHPTTWDDLLRMTAGLRWNEDYDPDSGSDVVEMLFGEGRGDVARYTAAKPIDAPPGQRFVYSSGTSNLIARALGGHLRATGTSVAELLRDKLFRPIGMTSPIPKYDARGTWIASSYCFATALDFARFGQLYLRDGDWNGRHILPAGWVDHARTTTPSSVGEENFAHGAHWWIADDRHGTFLASGYEGQYIVVSPGTDSVIVRLGQSTDEQRDHCWAALQQLVNALA